MSNEPVIKFIVRGSSITRESLIGFMSTGKCMLSLKHMWRGKGLEELFSQFL